MKQAKLTVALMLCLCGLMLQGCDMGKSPSTTTNNGQTSSSLTSGDNNGQTSSSLTPREDQSVFAFRNKMGANVDSVTVTTLKNPEEIIMETHKLDCTNVCRIIFPKDKTGKDLLFTFNDPNKKIVAAYIWLQGSRKSILHLSAVQLGYYVVYQMKQNNEVYQKNPLKLMAQLKELFSNYTDATYTLLGNYFKANVIEGNLSEKEFYNKLNKVLSDNTVLSNDVIHVDLANAEVKPTQKIIEPGRMAKSMFAANKVVNDTPPSTNPPPFVPVDVMKEACKSTTAISISDSLKTLSGFVPGLPGMALTGLFDYGILTLTASCPVYNIQDVMESIDVLSNRIDELDKQMMSLNYHLDELGAELLIKTSVEKITGDFKDNFTQYEQSFDEYYQNFNGFDGEENKFKDLAGFVANNKGGLAALMDDTSKGRFHDAMRHTTDQVDKFYNLLPDQKITDLDHTLTLLFKDENKISGDVINSRIKANVLINYFASKMITASMASSAMLHDEINIVLSALASGEITQAWLDSHQMGSFCTSPIDGKIVRWEDAHNFVDNLTENKLKFLQKTLVGDGCQLENSDSLFSGGCSKMYPPLRGFPNGNGLFGRFVVMCGEKGSIDAWYTKAPDNKPYIEVSCFGGLYNYNDSNTATVPDRSRYYYTSNTKPQNVLGALVPLNGTTGGFAYTYDAHPLDINNSPIQDPVNRSVTYENKIISNYPLSVFSRLRSSANTPMIGQVGMDGNSPTVAPYVITYSGVPINTRDGSILLSVLPETEYPAASALSALKVPLANQVFYSKIKVPVHLLGYYDVYPYGIWGGTRDGSLSPCADSKVYMSFKSGGITYPFALHIKAYGDAYYDASGNTIASGIPYFSGNSELVWLECLSQQCSTLNPKSGAAGSLTWDTPSGQIEVSLVKTKSVTVWNSANDSALKSVSFDKTWLMLRISTPENHKGDFVVNDTTI